MYVYIMVLIIQEYAAIDPRKKRMMLAPDAECKITEFKACAEEDVQSPVAIEEATQG